MKELSLRTRIWIDLQRLPDQAEELIHSAVVESGAICNLRCPFCPTGNGELRLSREFLGLPQFRTILDSLGPGLRTVMLYSWGEPLLNPEIFGMFAEARARGLATSISTNFSLGPAHFSPRHARRLIQSGLSRLEVACDGARQESYQLYRVGGDFERVMLNLRIMLEAKGRAGGATPEIVWVFHVHKGNQPDMPEASRKAAALGIPIVFKNLYFPSAMKEDWAPPAQKPARAGRPPKKSGAAAPVLEHIPGLRCLSAWRAPIVHSDGSVFPCCVAVQPEHSLGNVFRESMRAIWNGALVTAMRRYLRTGIRTRPDLPCYACSHNPQAEP
jgi:radical SAM protein with 4Fe4S-binding SPASM domain